MADFLSGDIGRILFADILKMTEYPGGVFVGNTIIHNLVMYFLLPTGLIFIFVWITAGRFLENQKLRLLLGIMLYLFIIFGGWYPFFAHLVGSYLIFLIIFGLILFLASHFGFSKKNGGGDTGGGGGGDTGGGGQRDVAQLVREYKIVCEQVEKGEEEYDNLKKQSEKNPGAFDRAVAAQLELLSKGKQTKATLELEIERQKMSGKIKDHFERIKKRYS